MQVQSVTGRSKFRCDYATVSRQKRRDRVRNGGRYGLTDRIMLFIRQQMYKSPVTGSQGLGTLILADTCEDSDRNQILAGLASNVTTSLIPFNDIKIISAP